MNGQKRTGAEKAGDTQNNMTRRVGDDVEDVEVQVDTDIDVDIEGDFSVEVDVDVDTDVDEDVDVDVGVDFDIQDDIDVIVGDDDTEDSVRDLRLVISDFYRLLNNSHPITLGELLVIQVQIDNIMKDLRRSIALEEKLREYRRL